jgi:hypothetical protein
MIVSMAQSIIAHRSEATHPLPLSDQRTAGADRVDTSADRLAPVTIAVRPVILGMVLLGIVPLTVET